MRKAFSSDSTFNLRERETMNKRGRVNLGPKGRAVETISTVGKHYVLQLYVTGSTPHSTRAITNIRELCEKYLEGRYDLDVIDMSQDPAQAKGEQIIAAPTLIKRLPLPLRRFIGDMSHTERILLGLDLHEFNEAATSKSIPERL